MDGVPRLNSSGMQGTPYSRAHSSVTRNSRFRAGGSEDEGRLRQAAPRGLRRLHRRRESEREEVRTGVAATLEHPAEVRRLPLRDDHEVPRIDDEHGDVHDAQELLELVRVADPKWLAVQGSLPGPLEPVTLKVANARDDVQPRRFDRLARHANPLSHAPIVSVTSCPVMSYPCPDRCRLGTPSATSRRRLVGRIPDVELVARDHEEQDAVRTGPPHRRSPAL